MKQNTRCGYIAIIGRPNVGKSTLLNHILGQKLCITSRKPQTTRHRILGVKTIDNVQAIFVDTPGIHQNGKKAINHYMNKAAMASMRDVEVILFVVDATYWNSEDDAILNRLKQQKVPVIMVINKIDKIKNKRELLPLIQSYSEKMDFKAVMPISALKSVHLEKLEQTIYDLLPESEHYFEEIGRAHV